MLFVKKLSYIPNLSISVVVCMLCCLCVCRFSVCCCWLLAEATTQRNHCSSSSLSFPGLLAVCLCVSTSMDGMTALHVNCVGWCTVHCSCHSRRKERSDWSSVLLWVASPLHNSSRSAPSVNSQPAVSLSGKLLHLQTDPPPACTCPNDYSQVASSSDTHTDRRRYC